MFLSQMRFGWFVPWKFSVFRLFLLIPNKNKCRDIRASHRREILVFRQLGTCLFSTFVQKISKPKTFCDRFYTGTMAICKVKRSSFKSFQLARVAPPGRRHPNGLSGKALRTPLHAGRVPLDS